MTNTLPKFGSPPLVETVLGVQFSLVAGFTSAHAGVYWKEVLGDKWPRVQEAPKLDDVREKFGPESSWQPQFGIRMGAGPISSRVQFISDDDEHMIQVQDSRFLMNWRRREGDYPSYDRLLPEFELQLERFGSFLTQRSIGKLAPNQWELTYVNHIPRGELWSCLRDWKYVIPGVVGSTDWGEETAMESMSSNTSLIIGDQRGRLHVKAQHARAGGGTETEQEVIRLELTARGPTEDNENSIRRGLDIGHAAIVEAFAALSSSKAHEAWGRIV